MIIQWSYGHTHIFNRSDGIAWSYGVAVWIGEADSAVFTPFPLGLFQWRCNPRGD